MALSDAALQNCTPSVAATIEAAWLKRISPLDSAAVLTGTSALTHPLGLVVAQLVCDRDDAANHEPRFAAEPSVPEGVWTPAAVALEPQWGQVVPIRVSRENLTVPAPPAWESEAFAAQREVFAAAAETRTLTDSVPLIPDKGVQ